VLLPANGCSGSARVGRDGSGDVADGRKCLRVKWLAGMAAMRGFAHERV
jgi:hypothetical protein